MAFLNDLKKNLTATGQTVAQKTKELTETMQLKSQLNSEKEAMMKAYAAIGKQVFETAAWDDKRKYESEFETINECMETIAELEKKLTELDGCIFCSECGARVDKKSAFCNKCGAKIVKGKGFEREADDDPFVEEIKEEIVEFVEESKED